jgi:DNA helicase II / ATP-dependent DNA helicase PcrA
MQQLWRKTSEWPSEIDHIRKWYQPHLEEKFADAAVRTGDLEQLAKIAASYPARAAFLTDLTLDPPQATERRSRKAAPR